MEDKNEKLETVTSGLNQVQGQEPLTNVETKKEMNPEEKEKLQKQQDFFRMLRMGGAFIKFILDDLKKQTRSNCNRHSRRRIEKELKKGIISGELVSLYINQLDAINTYFEEKLNPAKEVDGAEFYEKAKKESK